MSDDVVREIRKKYVSNRALRIKGALKRLI